MAEEPQLESRTKLPTEVEDEDPFLAIAEIKLSLRQCLTLAMSTAAWFILSQLTGSVLPISSAFSMILWSWLLIGGVFLTFAKKDGRPYEEYLTQVIQFRLSDRHYILKSPDNAGNIEDADWDELEDEDAGYWT